MEIFTYVHIYLLYARTHFYAIYSSPARVLSRNKKISESGLLKSSLTYTNIDLYVMHVCVYHVSIHNYSSPARVLRRNKKISESGLLKSSISFARSSLDVAPTSFLNTYLRTCTHVYQCVYCCVSVYQCVYPHAHHLTSHLPASWIHTCVHAHMDISVCIFCRYAHAARYMNTIWWRRSWVHAHMG